MTKRSSRRRTCLVSTFKPKTISNALKNEDWISAMNEEIEKIERNKIWSLDPDKRQECDRN